MRRYVLAAGLILVLTLLFGCGKGEVINIPPFGGDSVVISKGNNYVRIEDQEEIENIIKLLPFEYEKQGKEQATEKVYNISFIYEGEDPEITRVSVIDKENIIYDGHRCQVAGGKEIDVEYIEKLFNK